MKIVAMLLVLGLAACVQAQERGQEHELPSVLVTPRVRLDVVRQAVRERVQEQPVQQAQPQMQYEQPVQQMQPQVIYVQAPPVQQQQGNPMFQQYMQRQVWFNAHYARRGILFPRYVRRSFNDPVHMRYMMMGMMR